MKWLIRICLAMAVAGATAASAPHVRAADEPGTTVPRASDTARATPSGGVDPGVSIACAPGCGP